ncbi:MAG: Tol-Pal system beta propeller repeat protein TolB [Paracoccus sp. (in: a-proteobacteria)]|uniref:Tol-Pal system beta propeller repeat protein TolB n=1 Tax=Paracoccus sp. TaxID=267 RepID=UPI0026E0A3C8|nr:Tol-Pal system beta propeller repeat protein TolB [Paracoccus sp. (in: a-proteobacteria)]MDO5613279.1 Tol-Pal system beta propeller repeat protein TolB [Paracoccus sp. (in: a-proteobacteria)]
MFCRVIPFCALLTAALPLAAPAFAQDQEGPLRIEITDGVTEPMPLAIAPFHGDADMAAKVRQVVIDDLTGTSLFRAIPDEAHITTPASFRSPVAYADWRAINAQALVTGDVAVTGEGDAAEVTVKFRLFDVVAGQPLGEGMQFVTAHADWRRAAHKIADQIYARLTGEGPYFDSRVAFIQETGPKDARRMRLGVMDFDGANPVWLTDDSHLVLSPRFSPDGTSILFTSFETGVPQIRVMDVESVTSRPLTSARDSMAFAPRWSPDGRWIVYSREKRGNSDIWLMDAATGAARPLAESPGIDTSPDFSPDGSQIVFESDRSGTQQLYVQPLTGSEPARISFGEGRYSSPVWSPRGDMIAFTRQNGDTFHIGAMRTDGSGERSLTESFLDESPSWAPNGRVVMFTRVTPGGDGAPRLHSVDITGRNMRPLDLDFAASDPSWGPLLP